MGFGHGSQRACSSSEGHIMHRKPDSGAVQKAAWAGRGIEGMVQEAKAKASPAVGRRSVHWPYRFPVCGCQAFQRGLDPVAQRRHWIRKAGMIGIQTARSRESPIHRKRVA